MRNDEVVVTTIVETTVRPTNISRTLYFQFVGYVRCSGLNIRNELENALSEYLPKKEE